MGSSVYVLGLFSARCILLSCLAVSANVVVSSRSGVPLCAMPCHHMTPVACVCMLVCRAFQWVAHREAHPYRRQFLVLPVPSLELF